MGFDLGTTSVKVCLINKITGQIEDVQSQETNSQISTKLASLQDVKTIFKAIEECCSKLCVDKLDHVEAVAVCGQMHGCVFWKQTDVWNDLNSSIEDVEVSSLYTWMDDRCHPDFLSRLPPPHSHVKLSTGFGCCTIFWFLKNRPEFLAKFNRCATIQDLFVAYLCRLFVPVTCDQNAASWGYFDTISNTWNVERLKEHDFPVNLLPVVVESNTVVGITKTNWLNLPTSCKVYVALGDFQCSVFAVMESEYDAVLNISTSAQLTFLKPKGFLPSIPVPKNQMIDYFPFFDNRYLAVAASLNGGNVLASFVKMLHQWTTLLGADISEANIWKKLSESNTEVESSMIVDPTIFGERYKPEKRASISNIGFSSLQLNEVYYCVCKGLISNLQSFISAATLQENGIQRILGSGNAFLKNAILQQEVRRQYNVPVVCCAGKDAAIGAALSIVKNQN
ncbi:sedoheptulokinase-like [Centruroides vittatus]|uniref:sedoheptulokinase-like n=1 Tax=Centruroides vittatus TaxID=120091 RepID=UPI00350EE871